MALERFVVERFVVDASVAAKWYLPAKQESHVVQALELLRRFSEHEVALLVPGLYWTELANVLWKAGWSGRLTPAEAQRQISDAQRLPLVTVPEVELVESTLEIALVTGRTTYDATYLALAVDQRATLVTADERLVNATATRWPVRWLASI